MADMGYTNNQFFFLINTTEQDKILIAIPQGDLTGSHVFIIISRKNS